MKVCIAHKKFSPVATVLIEHVNRICKDFIARGYSLTLRQIYYQFVGHNLFPDEWLVKLPGGIETKNHDRNYKKLGDLVSDARRAGLIDWNHVTDRTRTFKGKYHWDSVSELIRSVEYSYNIDRWVGQPEVPEVWVEKDALIDVLAGVARKWDTTAFSTRGFPSDSSLWEVAQRCVDRYDQSGQTTIIYHFADHDPSGIDMTRAIQATLDLMGAGECARVERRALIIDQVDGLPPSPAKTTDSRTPKYVEAFGTEDTWELDALDPDLLASLVESAIENTIHDAEAWDDRIRIEREGRATIRKIANDHENS